MSKEEVRYATCFHPQECIHDPQGNSRYKGHLGLLEVKPKWAWGLNLPLAVNDLDNTSHLTVSIMHNGPLNIEPHSGDKYPHIPHPIYWVYHRSTVTCTYIKLKKKTHWKQEGSGKWVSTVGNHQPPIIIIYPLMPHAFFLLHQSRISFCSINQQVSFLTHLRCSFMFTCKSEKGSRHGLPMREGSRVHYLGEQE